MFPTSHCECHDITVESQKGSRSKLVMSSSNGERMCPVPYYCESSIFLSSLSINNTSQKRFLIHNVCIAVLFSQSLSSPSGRIHRRSYLIFRLEPGLHDVKTYRRKYFIWKNKGKQDKSATSHMDMCSFERSPSLLFLSIPENNISFLTQLFARY